MNKKLNAKNKSLALTGHDPDLARKFEEASRKKLGIEDFCNEFLGEFLSEGTKRAYVQDLKYFFDFLRQGGQIVNHPSEIQSYHFALYRDSLINRGLASATINRRLVAIRSFMKWSVASNLITHSPLDTIKLPKVQTESPTVAFDDVEVMRMISAPSISTHKGRVHRLIMVMLFNLGLRRSELVNIKLGHFCDDRGHSVLRIRGKGDKLRIIPINDYVGKEIKDYLDFLTRQGINLEETDYLLQTELHKKNSRPMDGSTIYRVVERYARSLGIEKEVSPHSCRATVISHLLDTRHTPIRDVATFAGHANITTTERYDKRRNNLDKSAAYEVDYDIEEEFKKVD